MRKHLRGRAPSAVSAEGQFFEHQRAVLLLEELAQVLSERQLQVVALFLEEQAHERQTYEEIGRELGMSPGASARKPAPTMQTSPGSEEHTDVLSVDLPAHQRLHASAVEGLTGRFT